MLIMIERMDKKMAAKNYFLSGITELLILYFLNQKDCYVYEITKAISDFSDGALVISQNTIYTAAYKLEKDNMITEYSKLVGKKRTRVYYHVEDAGRVYLNELLETFQTTFQGISQILTKQIKEEIEDENE